jgi:hypothetical protein
VFLTFLLIRSCKNKSRKYSRVPNDLSRFGYMDCVREQIGGGAGPDQLVLNEPTSRPHRIRSNQVKANFAVKGGSGWVSAVADHPIPNNSNSWTSPCLICHVIKRGPPPNESLLAMQGEKKTINKYW